jgi:hypothetical protein
LCTAPGWTIRMVWLTAQSLARNELSDFSDL